MVTIETFQKIIQIGGENDETTADILTIALLSGISEDAIRRMPIDKYRELKSKVDVDTTPPDTIIEQFEVDGKSYKVDTVFKVAGQFMDFSQLSKDIIPNLHLILAVFAHEGNYMQGVKERAEVFRTKVDYKIAYSVAFFFSRLMRELSKAGEIYSQAEAQDGMKKSGAGQQRLMGYLVATAANGNIFSKWIARNFLITYLK